ncbi:hypothetical protein [Cupriavidus pinatubonensis]|uniref:Uncharacterized protein n=1 Tax=Cupriavidus pinatubonensis TaxID=248026 RepID=A0ABM8WEC5_9BURK|nr:hypothetical protein [Cupriavidus pinatubonensis]CAG9165648.1 hypothetical protein LMG23994_00769 [Cupriavidus pinatubonensis]
MDHQRTATQARPTSFPRGPLTERQVQDALALYHRLPQDVASGEAVIRRAATTAYVNGFEDCKQCFGLPATVPAPAGCLPVAPDIALLASIAVCLNHGFGALKTECQEAQLATARQVYNEVAGIGAYRPGRRDEFLSWLSRDIPGGMRDPNESTFGVDRSPAAGAIMPPLPGGLLAEVLALLRADPDQPARDLLPAVESIFWRARS